ncbi:MAG: phospholipase [Deltaproteobacteria bacterium HGW-Deltaproteobacteria-14]|jgi:phosphatidylserine/phosphatidylglycerophosphate/cardiolipin synthase-like enzyme|nr:MAG: phospholipase [Deltaproteobacteria bacterium HGW-Deltaproteobacteria-14]
MYALPRALPLLPPLLLALLTGCGTARAVGGPAPPEAATIELIESVPVETTLDHADVRDAFEVWPQMIGRATKTLDIAEFYVISEPGKRMAPVLEAIAAAGARGVKVRILADAKFAKQYHDDLDRLGTVDNVRVVQWDVGPTLGGVLHAKYFVVDGVEAYLGSQNFDWRSLEHIQELGLRVRVPEVVGFLSDVFATDWGLATGAPTDARVSHVPASAFPVQATFGGEPAKITAVGSPVNWLPDEALWELPRLVGLIDGAKKRVSVQLLAYETRHRGEEPFDTLDDALRRAALRGVTVRLMVANWNLRGDRLPALEKLAAVPGVEVRFVSIPEATTGFVSFARVCHSKLMLVDDDQGWVGTSNWGRGYFYGSRNVGVIVASRAFNAQLARFFGTTWDSPYAETLVPGRRYEAPRISD